MESRIRQCRDPSRAGGVGNAQGGRRMIYPTVLAFAGIHHQRVQAHLFPGDGLEAAAILLCGRSTPPKVRLLVRDIILVPYDACRIRRTDSLTWPGHYIEQAIDRAEREDLTIVLIHSHPGGLLASSVSDDGRLL